MTVRSRPDEALPLAQARQVDEACCRFEAAWQAAASPEERPRIETFLDAVPEMARSALVNELVALEIELRRGAGEASMPEEYRDRFPSLAPAEQTIVQNAAETPEAMSLAHLHIPGYEIIQELGRGGMGVVYWAWQNSLHRPVALKMILSGACAGSEALTRFRTEAEAVARLHHPNIVQVYEVGAHESCPYMVLEYVNGGSLAKCQGGVPLPPEKAAPLVETLARAIHYAHERGIVHRDLSPANVLLTSDDVPKITDFGLAKLVIGGGPTLTQSGDILGTPSYMAPEQVGGGTGVIGPATDVYALGALLYQLITGQPPFKAETPVETLLRVQSADPIPPRRLQPKLPRDLATIAMKCLEKEPAKRYASALAMAEDLERFQAGEPIRARPVGQTERLWRWCRRNPVVAALMATVLLLLVALSGGALVKNAELSAVNDQLGAANAQLGAALADSEEANRQAKAKLWESLRDRARALRMSRAPGQRVESLHSIRQALELPVPPGHSLQELQTEAVAALALPDLEALREWQGYPVGAVGLDFDGNLERYARLGSDGSVTVRRVSDDSVIGRWAKPIEEPWPDSPGQNLRFSPDGRFVALRQLWSGHLTLLRFDGPDGVVCHQSAEEAIVRSDYPMDFSPDSNRLAYLLTDQSGSRTVVVDLPSGQARYLSPSRAAEEADIRFAPDGGRFALAVRRGSKWAIEVRDTATGDVRQTLRHDIKPLQPAWHPDGQTLAACYHDRLIRCWDVRLGKLIRELRGLKDLGIRCAFSHGGDRLLSSDWTNMLRVWEPSSGALLLSLPAGGYRLLQVSPDDRVVAGGTDTTKTQVLRLHSGVAYRSIAMHLGTLAPGIRSDDSLHVHPEGRLLAAAATDYTLVLVDLSAGREVANTRHNSYMPICWDNSNDLLSSGTPGLFRWPLRADPTEPGRYHFGPYEKLLADKSHSEWGISADCQIVAIPAFNRGTVLVHRGPPSRRIDLRPQEDVRTCAISRDGRWIASGSHNSSDGFGAKVWDAASGAEVKKFPVLGLCRVAFSPDDRWLLTTGGGCRLWKVGSWEEVHKVGGVFGCFSPDGGVLAVNDSAGAIRLIRPDSGMTLLRLEAPEQTRLNPRGFTPDGARLIAVGTDTQALHIWDLRVVRQGLRELGLEGDLPSYPSPAAAVAIPPIRID